MLIISTVTHAKDLGIMGETYPIAETDFLEYIQARLNQMQQNGEWQHVQAAMQQHASNYRDRPTPVSGVELTTTTRSWLMDPSIVLDHDVIAPDGKLIATKGTRVNPLVYVPLSKTLIFINADDAEQVKWAKQEDTRLQGKSKIILVNGSVLTSEKRLNKMVYFDQVGNLTRHFNIRHVPSTISQDGMMLRISEVKP